MVDGVAVTGDATTITDATSVLAACTVSESNLDLLHDSPRREQQARLLALPSLFQSPPGMIDLTTADTLPESAKFHWREIRNYYDNTPPLRWAARAYRQILAHYYNKIIPANASVLEIGCGCGELLAGLTAKNVHGIDISEIQIERARKNVPYGVFHVQAGETLDLGDQIFDYIIISDTLNLVADVQRVFERLLRHSDQNTRLVLNYHSTLWRPVLSLASFLKLNPVPPERSWLAPNDIHSLLDLTGWQKIKSSMQILVPVNHAGVGGFFNRWLAPLFPWFCLSVFTIARPFGTRIKREPSASVIIPARNEAGNIENAVLRTPSMGAETELIFVEGHSSDNTWAEIERVAAKYGSARKIRTLRQTGRGKGNAVREGFAAAQGDILMILDADLTMPPEELPKYYEAIASGRADFANGCRLVYPMEGKAMRFLNLCANKAFSILFSWLLRQPVKDTLCGTKVLTAKNYQLLAANRSYFGDFDPFGDFDLIFGADKLNLKIVDIPIRYRDRTYGQTNIQRWRHGWLLLRMVLFAARKLRFV